MNHNKLKSLLSSPSRVLGFGSKEVVDRKVAKMWPSSIALAALMMVGQAASAHSLHSSDVVVVDPEIPEVVDSSRVDGSVAFGFNVEKSPIFVINERGLIETNFDQFIGEDENKKIDIEVGESSTKSFDLYYQKLGGFVSLEGESKDDFMKRVGRFIANYTRATGWEACGMLQKEIDGDGWMVNLVTNGSQLACVRMDFKAAGYETTRENIHSHPYKTSLRASLQDVRLTQNFFCGSVVRTVPDKFSHSDFKHGPGYLVYQNGVNGEPRMMYQNGSGTEIELGEISGIPQAIPVSESVGDTVAMDGVSFVPLNDAEIEPLQTPMRSCKPF